MQRHQKVIQLAKKMVLLSKDREGVITESRVGEVLAGLRQVQPPHHLLLLRKYWSYLRREIALQTAEVASPAALSPEALEAIAQHYTKIYDRPIQAVATQDASLIAGVRVSVGDDRYDASVLGRLKRLAERVH
ncbi:MAG: ATP synthase subunit delta [Opitutia bacterium UBA7350]|nr:MAG: ATP synthase subunit delta [Opitutae bacterium UBA7350]